VNLKVGFAIFPLVNRVKMDEWPPIWSVAANVLNKQLRTEDKGWSPSLRLGELLTIPRRKNWYSHEI